MNHHHPVRDPRIVADIEAWTEQLLSRTNAATVIVEFNMHEGKCVGYRLGGVASREKMPQENLDSRTG